MERVSGYEPEDICSIHIWDIKVAVIIDLVPPSTCEIQKLENPISCYMESTHEVWSNVVK